MDEFITEGYKTVFFPQDASLCQWMMITKSRMPFLLRGGVYAPCPWIWGGSVTDSAQWKGTVCFQIGTEETRVSTFDFLWDSTQSSPCWTGRVWALRWQSRLGPDFQSAFLLQTEYLCLPSPKLTCWKPVSKVMLLGGGLLGSH